MSSKNSYAFSRFSLAFSDVAEVIIVFVSTVLTFVITDGTGINSVIVSAAIGLLGSFLPATQLVDKNALHAAIYTGTFAGMCSTVVVITPAEIAVVGLFAGMLYVATKPLFSGIGGKLGSIAFIACLVMFWGEGNWW